MSDDKYLPVHVDIYDSMMRNLVEEALNKDLTKGRSVTHIVRLDETRWLVRLEYSVVKDLDMKQSPLGKPDGCPHKAVGICAACEKVR